jgi:hypothetical protein
LDQEAHSEVKLKKKVRPPRAGLPFPPSSSRESRISEKLLSVARLGRQNGTNYNSQPALLGRHSGCTENEVMGFPPHHRGWVVTSTHHRFPRNGTRSPGAPPRRRGFSFAQARKRPGGTPHGRQVCRGGSCLAIVSGVDTHRTGRREVEEALKLLLDLPGVPFLLIFFVL